MPRRVLVGVVIKKVMPKTATMEVERKFRHPKYEKIVVKKKKYLIHDPKDQLKVGDVIKVIEGRPVSKRKVFWLKEIIHKGE